MQVFNSFSFTLPRLLVCWNLNSFKIYHDIVVGKCFLLTSINILFYIDYTVRVILRHLLCLYFVITKASLDILLVMLLDTISNDLIPYILFTNLCMVYIVFVFFCKCSSIYVDEHKSKSKLVLHWLFNFDLVEIYP